MAHLKISIVVARAVIPAMPMHFDDILAAAAVKVALKSGTEIEDYDSVIGYLPLEKHINGDDWVWKASVIRWKSYGRYMRSLTQSHDPVLVANLRDSGVLKAGGSSLNQGSGPMKSSISLIASAAYSTGVAYCDGDLESIKALLNELDYIGKKHQRGAGEVISFSVEEVEPNENWKDRFLPLSMKNEKLESHSLASDIGTKPPYWLNKRAIAWAVPTK